MSSCYRLDAIMAEAIMGEDASDSPGSGRHRQRHESMISVGRESYSPRYLQATHCFSISLDIMMGFTVNVLEILV